MRKIDYATCPQFWYTINSNSYAVKMRVFSENISKFCWKCREKWNLGMRKKIVAVISPPGINNSFLFVFWHLQKPMIPVLNIFLVKSRFQNFKCAQYTQDVENVNLLCLFTTNTTSKINWFYSDVKIQKQ